MHNEKIKWISIFCDYTADGIWVNGCMTNIKSVVQELNIDINVDKLAAKIDKWQRDYEKLELYNDEISDEELYTSEEFIQFEKLGKEIAHEVRRIIPKEYPVYYFDEKKPYKKYIVNFDGSLTEIDYGEI